MAITDLSRAIELKPDDFYTYYTRGKAWFMKADYQKAIDDHDKELELEEGRPLARLERANALINLDRADEALPDLNRVIAFDDMTAGYFARSLVWEKRGDKAAALADLRYYLDRVPDDQEARYRWEKLSGPATQMPAPLIKGAKSPLAERVYSDAFVNLHMGWYYEAVDALNKLIKAEPKNAYAYFYRGWILEMQASELNGKKTIEDYTKAIALDPKFAEAYLHRAWRYNFGNSALAPPDVAKARLVEPKSAHAAFRAAGIQMRNDKWIKALPLYTEAIKLDPLYADAYLARADGYVEAKMYDKAVADYTAVVKINANDYRAYEGRAKAYCALKKKELAAADAEKAEELGAQDVSACEDE